MKVEHILYRLSFYRKSKCLQILLINCSLFLHPLIAARVQSIVQCLLVRLNQVLMARWRIFKHSYLNPNADVLGM